MRPTSRDTSGLTRRVGHILCRGCLDALGYPYWDESDNPAYRIFLNGAAPEHPASQAEGRAAALEAVRALI